MLTWLVLSFVLGAPPTFAGLLPIIRWCDGYRVEWNRLVAAMILIMAGVYSCYLCASNSIQAARQEHLERTRGYNAAS